jgi:tetratricopeptide (TPR) repeat protein
MISTFNSVYSMPMPLVNQYAATYKEALQNEPNAKDLNRVIAFCYLKLKLYDKALSAFEKAMEENFDNSETFFYAAICLLGGKKAFLAQRPEIDKIEKYINAALMIEQRGIYYYFWAYIKFDYFNRKFFNTSPNYQELLEMAKNAGFSPLDIDQLYGILGVSRPEVL